MDNILLDVQVREKLNKGKTKQLRVNGFLPGVVYGQQQKAVNILVKLKELEQALGKGGAKGLITLNIKSEDDKVSRMPVMVKEYQVNPIKGNISHIDFYQVNLKEKVTAQVAVILTGEAQGVKEGGILQQQLRTVDVECLPTSIPASLTYDITDLAVGDQVTISNLTVPEGVEMLTESEKVVANIIMPKAVEEEGEHAPGGEETGEATEAGEV